MGPKTIVLGAAAAGVARGADTPGFGQPKLTTETPAHRNYRWTVFGCSGRVDSDPGEGSPTVATKFNIEERWPELFVQLDETQRRAVVQSLASAWHEGWTPNREDVENLTDEARGAIDAAEYRRRAHAAARRRTVAVAR